MDKQENSKRKMSDRSLANLNPKARYQGKVRVNLTLLPETFEWLKQDGNASQKIEDLVLVSKKNLEADNNFADDARNESSNAYKLIEENQRLKELVDKFRKELDDRDTYLSSYVEDSIKEILDNNRSKVAGFKSNSFSQGIKALKSLLVDLG